tara:strand:+ start:126 stop:1412 length:1287 start_codon:yes stop_codon:yes gene_type:complete
METLPSQIGKDFNIPYDPNNSEAFLYKFTNLKDNSKYIGIHKGKPFDGYMFSSTNEEFHKEFLDPNADFQYDVLQYGTYKYVQAEENRLLIEVDAKNNPKFYNKTNGGSSLVIPRMDLIKYIVDQIVADKSYDGIVATYKAIKDLSDFKLQIREFSLSKHHVNVLRDIINHKSSLEHLQVIILQNRTYRGQKGDLIIDGNHSIEAAKISKIGAAGNIPALVIPENKHKDWTDDEVDLLSLMCNPRDGNPRLQSSYEDIAREICKLRLKGLDAASKEIIAVKDYFKLTTSEKSKVSKLARQMYEEQVPNSTTWIDYGTGSEGRVVKDLIERECMTHGHNTGILSVCYSSAKYDAWRDLHKMILWNRNNPNKLIDTYKVRFYHKDKNYENKWFKTWAKDNEFVIDSLLKEHGIKRNWIYLPSTRSKVTTK